MCVKVVLEVPQSRHLFFEGLCDGLKLFAECTDFRIHYNAS